MIMNPTVNMNGDIKQTLVDQRLAVTQKLHEAMEAIRQMNPHGRNYIGNDHQYLLDRAENSRRLNLLLDMYDELMKEAVAIQDQGRN